MCHLTGKIQFLAYELGRVGGTYGAKCLQQPPEHRQTRCQGPLEETRTFFRHFEADEIPVEPLRYDCTPGSTPNAGKISPGPFQNYRPKIGP